jgi:hypothetical protein
MLEKELPMLLKVAAKKIFRDIELFYILSAGQKSLVSIFTRDKWTGG